MEFSQLRQRFELAFQEYLDSIIKAIPGILGGLLLLLLGWALAKLLRRLVLRVIESTGLNAMAQRGGIGKLFERLGGLAVVVSTMVFWVVQLFFILASAEVMEMGLVTEGIHRFFAYLPALVTAAGIFVLGVWLGDQVQGFINKLGGSVGIMGSRVIGRIFFFLIVLFMSITALNMIGVDTTLITSNILLFFGGMLVAFSVAYGFASRDILSNMLSSYYGRDRFHVGQRIRIGTDEGVIERIDSMSITLRTHDRVVMIPARQLVTERIEVLEEEHKA